MGKNILILEELQVALQYWADVNLFAETLLKVSLTNKAILPRDYKKPLMGSELDENNFLSHPVKNWRGFKYGTESNRQMNPLDFLPRVPTTEKGKYTPLNYMRSRMNKTIASFPYFLSKWLSFKKVFSIDNLSLIKPVSIEEKNYFSFLPYGSFVIKFNDPLYLSVSKEIELRQSCAIITMDEDDIIDVLFLHNDLKERAMNPGERDMLLKGKVRKYEGGVDFIKDSPLFGMSIAVEHGKAVSDIHSGPENNQNSSTLAMLNNFKEQDGNWGDPIIALLNGFCKVISELPKTIIVENGSKEEKGSVLQKDKKYDWNEVPITQIVDMGNVESLKRYAASIGNGSEKSPHWRRGHWRNIPLKNGSFARTWIPQTLVREDKLETENINGSATVLKNKEKN